MKFIQKYFFKLPEKIRFLLVGGYNTAFGMALYAMLYWLLGESVHYVILLVVTHFISVINSYLALKFFVFRTNGNFMQEFIRTNISYFYILLANSALLTIFVQILLIPPVTSQCFIAVLLACGSYFLHKYYSYRQRKSPLH